MIILFYPLKYILREGSSKPMIKLKLLKNMLKINKEILTLEMLRDVDRALSLHCYHY